MGGNKQKTAVGEGESLMDFLPQVLRRPGMFLKDRHGTHLECLLCGWKFALDYVSLRDEEYDEFEGWLQKSRDDGGGPLTPLSKRVEMVGEEAGLQWITDRFEEYCTAQGRDDRWVRLGGDRR